MFFFSAVLATLFYVFFKISIADVYLPLTLSFYSLFLFAWWVSSLSGLFSCISSFFFPLFSFTAYPFLINCSLFARDFKQLFYNSFIHLSISLLPQIHENLIIDMKRAILLATFMLVLHLTKGNTFISSLLILIKKLW